MRTQEQQAIDRRIERLYGQRCSGVQIDIMDIEGIYRLARTVARFGATDAQLGDAIAGEVERVRQN